jgi:hypothetical protein
MQAGYRCPVADTRHGGTLAGTHAGQPGLPRGRSRLPLRAVRASQRERLERTWAVPGNARRARPGPPYLRMPA